MTHETSLRGVLRRVLRHNAAQSLLTLLVIGLAVATALFPPLVLEKAVNALTAGQTVPFVLALSYLGFIALSGLLESGQNVMITVLGQKITHGLRSALCAKLSRLPAAYFSQHEAGKISSRFVNDVDTVDSLFTEGIIGMFADSCKVVSILIVIFTKSTGLGLLILLVLPGIFAMTRLFQKRMLQAQLDNRAAVARVNNHVPETIRNIRMIHVLQREAYMERRYDGYIGESYRATDRSNLYDSLYSPIVIFLSACVIAAMMLFAAMGGEMRSFFGIGVGTAVAVIAYVGKVFDPLESIGMEIQNIQSAVAGVRRINEFLAEPEWAPAEPDDGAADETADPAATGCAADAGAAFIRFSRVRFCYGDGPDVLQDLSFSVRRGEAVTFVGRTGAGKSTVFRLLMGLYRPQSGSIRIGGRHAACVPARERRRLFGYVEQAFRLVDGTVAEQISLFDPDIGQPRIEAAAKLVGLHDTILALPQGYDTPAADVSFSQGQFQLLSIARAVAASPQILLLDEITANLDSGTERRVLDALDRAAAGRTVLSISHRVQAGIGQRQIRIGGDAAAADA